MRSKRFALCALGLFAFFFSCGKKEAELTVYPIADGTIMQAYAFETPNGVVIVDAGYSSETIRASLLASEIAPEDVIAVLLTHSDGDHVGALDAFPAAAVYFPRLEIPYVNGERKRVVKGRERDNSISRSDYITLADGDEIVFGGVTVLAIATPGHTAGSMSFLVNGAYLFTGDLIALTDDGVAEVFSPDVYTEDPETSKESIRALATLDGIVYIATAHTGIAVDADTAFAPWR